MTNYYLVSTQATTLSYFKAQAPVTMTIAGESTIVNQPSVWVENESVPINTVMNCIVYDGTSAFTVPTGMVLKSSTNVYNIGDVYNG